jgi:hypothetical protein
MIFYNNVEDVRIEGSLGTIILHPDQARGDQFGLVTKNESGFKQACSGDPYQVYQNC